MVLALKSFIIKKWLDLNPIVPESSVCHFHFMFTKFMLCRFSKCGTCENITNEHRGKGDTCSNNNVGFQVARRMLNHKAIFWLK